MMSWVIRTTEDFVCNTFRAMTMANFLLTQKPTLPGVWTAGGSSSWTMMMRTKTMTMISYSHCPIEKRVVHTLCGKGHDNKPKIYYIWTKLLLCHKLFLVPFFSLFIFHKCPHSRYVFLPRLQGGKHKETKREREFPFAVQSRIILVLNLSSFTGCDNSDRDKQLKQVFKNAQSVKKTWTMQNWATWGFCNELLYIKCDTSHELNQINQSKMSCRKDSVFWKTFPGMYVTSGAFWFKFGTANTNFTFNGGWQKHDGEFFFLLKTWIWSLRSRLREDSPTFYKLSKLEQISMKFGK